MKTLDDLADFLRQLGAVMQVDVDRDGLNVYRTFVLDEDGSYTAIARFSGWPELDAAVTRAFTHGTTPIQNGLGSISEWMMFVAIGQEDDIRARIANYRAAHSLD